jgi:hypothetical protein
MFRGVSRGDLLLNHVGDVSWMKGNFFGHGVCDIQGVVVSHLWVPL